MPSASRRLAAAAPSLVEYLSPLALFVRRSASPEFKYPWQFLAPTPRLRRRCVSSFARAADSFSLFFAAGIIYREKRGFTRVAPLAERTAKRDARARAHIRRVIAHVDVIALLLLCIEIERPRRTRCIFGILTPSPDCAYAFATRICYQCWIARNSLAKYIRYRYPYLVRVIVRRLQPNHVRNRAYLANGVFAFSLKCRTSFRVRFPPFIP